MQLGGAKDDKEEAARETSSVTPVSRLAQWPCQIKLLPTQAPFYDGAKILIAADCTAYAYAYMHEDFMKGKDRSEICEMLKEKFGEKNPDVKVQ